MAIRYSRPGQFLRYRLNQELFTALVDAKAGVEALLGLPYQKSWMEPLRELELKNEVAGTTMIEGATFAGDELDAALDRQTPAEMATRSQKQAISAKKAYGWVEGAPTDFPAEQAILEIHRLMVTGCDDDHCAPGQLRGEAQEVTFGRPPRGGAKGGSETREAFKALVSAANGAFREADPLLQALAIHYHLGAIHPFQDGNGRTARGAEAFFLRRAGFATHGLIGLSNYYYEERQRYLEVLAETAANDDDLTDFFVFGLRGIARQCARMRAIILGESKIVFFKNMMHRVYNKHRRKKKRFLNDRQLLILELLLENPERVIGPQDGFFWRLVRPAYSNLKNRGRAMARDTAGLVALGALGFSSMGLSLNLDWPQDMTESDFGKTILERPPRSAPKIPLG